MPRRFASMRSVFITPATSICCGQRVVQVWQLAQSQMALLSSACGSFSCTLRITWFGVKSKRSASAALVAAEDVLPELFQHGLRQRLCAGAPQSCDCARHSLTLGRGSRPAPSQIGSTAVSQPMAMM
jgi:hypothetical protein